MVRREDQSPEQALSTAELKEELRSLTYKSRQIDARLFKVYETIFLGLIRSDESEKAE